MDRPVKPSAFGALRFGRGARLANVKQTDGSVSSLASSLIIAVLIVCLGLPLLEMALEMVGIMLEAICGIGGGPAKPIPVSKERLEELGRIEGQSASLYGRRLRLTGDATHDHAAKAHYLKGLRVRSCHETQGEAEAKAYCTHDHFAARVLGRWCVVPKSLHDEIRRGRIAQDNFETPS